MRATHHDTPTTTADTTTRTPTSRGRPRRHRDYAEVRRLLGRARLDADARAARRGDLRAHRRGRGEAARRPVDRVAFHEVGAYDSIADVVGIAAAIAYLAPASVGSLPPVVGTGLVRTAHGPVPVPAPATAALLRRRADDRPTARAS